MTSDQRDEGLAAGLRDLGLHLGPDLDGPEPADVADAVVRRIAATVQGPGRVATDTPGPASERGSGRVSGPSGERAPEPGSSRALKPRIAFAVLAVLLAFGTAAAVSPQVRAAVTRVLRFAGVEVRSGPAPINHLPTSGGSAPTSATSPTLPTLPGERTVDLATARTQAAFPIAVPTALGTPQRVTVSDGAPPRVVSLFYDGVRIDEFDGGLSDYFTKYTLDHHPEQVAVNGTPGVWVSGPQDVVYIDRTGDEVTSTAHHADGTLIWQHGKVTLRIESSQGALDKARAIAIAQSAAP